MGIIKQGVLGAVSGKVGNVIGATWKGIDYLRIMPASIVDPQTVPQLNQRLKFAVAEAFVQPMSQWFRIGFKGYAIKMSGYNAALSYNIKNAIAGAYPAFTLDYPNALVARGTLEAPNTPSAVAAANEVVTFSWLNPAGAGNADDSDATYCILFNGSKGQGIFVGNLTTRADLTQSVAVPASWDGDTVQCYLCFTSVTTYVMSNSGFAGAVVILA